MSLKCSLIALDRVQVIFAGASSIVLMSSTERIVNLDILEANVLFVQDVLDSVHSKVLHRHHEAVSLMATFAARSLFTVDEEAGLN